MSINQLFADLEALQAGKSYPPVDQWHPEREGKIDIRIASDGTWFHEGQPIKRMPLVKLFASVLRREADAHFLVTPAEKLRIQVEDAPFVAVAAEVSGSGRNADILFSTNTDDHVVADADHVIHVAEGPRPYVHVRSGLQALIARSVFYRLVQGASQEGDEYVIYSRGSRFVLGMV